MKSIFIRLLGALLILLAGTILVKTWWFLLPSLVGYLLVLIADEIKR